MEAAAKEGQHEIVADVGETARTRGAQASAMNVDGVQIERGKGVQQKANNGVSQTQSGVSRTSTTEKVAMEGELSAKRTGSERTSAVEIEKYAETKRNKRLNGAKLQRQLLEAEGIETRSIGSQSTDEESSSVNEEEREAQTKGGKKKRGKKGGKHAAATTAPRPPSPSGRSPSSSTVATASTTNSIAGTSHAKEEDAEDVVYLNNAKITTHGNDLKRGHAGIRHRNATQSASRQSSPSLSSPSRASDTPDTPANGKAVSSSTTPQLSMSLQTSSFDDKDKITDSPLQFSPPGPPLKQMGLLMQDTYVTARETITELYGRSGKVQGLEKLKLSDTPRGLVFDLQSHPDREELIDAFARGLYERKVTKEWLLRTNPMRLAETPKVDLSRLRPFFTLKRRELSPTQRNFYSIRTRTASIAHLIFVGEYDDVMAMAHQTPQTIARLKHYEHTKKALRVGDEVSFPGEPEIEPVDGANVWFWVHLANGTEPAYLRPHSRATMITTVYRMPHTDFYAVNFEYQVVAIETRLVNVGGRNAAVGVKVLCASLERPVTDPKISHIDYEKDFKLAYSGHAPTIPKIDHKSGERSTSAKSSSPLPILEPQELEAGSVVRVDVQNSGYKNKAVKPGKGSRGKKASGPIEVADSPADSSSSYSPSASRPASPSPPPSPLPTFSEFLLTSPPPARSTETLSEPLNSIQTRSKRVSNGEFIPDPESPSSADHSSLLEVSRGTLKLKLHRPAQTANQQTNPSEDQYEEEEAVAVLSNASRSDSHHHRVNRVSKAPRCTPAEEFDAISSDRIDLVREGSGRGHHSAPHLLLRSPPGSSTSSSGSNPSESSRPRLVVQVSSNKKPKLAESIIEESESSELKISDLVSVLIPPVGHRASSSPPEYTPLALSSASAPNLRIPSSVTRPSELDILGEPLQRKHQTSRTRPLIDEVPMPPSSKNHPQPYAYYPDSLVAYELKRRELERDGKQKAKFQQHLLQQHQHQDLLNQQLHQQKLQQQLHQQHVRSAYEQPSLPTTKPNRAGHPVLPALALPLPLPLSQHSQLYSPSSTTSSASTATGKSSTSATDFHRTFTPVFAPLDSSLHASFSLHAPTMDAIANWGTLSNASSAASLNSASTSTPRDNATASPAATPIPSPGMGLNHPLFTHTRKGTNAQTGLPALGTSAAQNLHLPQNDLVHLSDMEVHMQLELQKMREVQLRAQIEQANRMLTLQMELDEAQRQQQVLQLRLAMSANPHAPVVSAKDDPLSLPFPPGAFQQHPSRR